MGLLIVKPFGIYLFIFSVVVPHGCVQCFPFVSGPECLFVFFFLLSGPECLWIRGKHLKKRKEI
jgi:hypothetical protein